MSTFSYQYNLWIFSDARSIYLLVPQTFQPDVTFTKKTEDIIVCSKELGNHLKGNDWVCFLPAVVLLGLQHPQFLWLQAQIPEEADW